MQDKVNGTKSAKEKNNLAKQVIFVKASKIDFFLLTNSFQAYFSNNNVSELKQNKADTSETIVCYVD